MLQAKQITSRQDLPELQSFLASNKLPFQDIRLDGNLFFIYSNEVGDFLGSSGLEMYGVHALIRSIAVHPEQRGKNVGKEIVDDILQRAKTMNIKSLFLLTETAHEFFLKRGFKDISRNEVPDAVKASAEFSFVCPASAKCMVYTL
jgi:amino-acid N-acetyltransferase